MADTGINNILDTLRRMEQSAQLRAMRSALNAAMNPAVKALRAAAPRGSEPHRTYKGRTVSPGFLSRSIIKSTRVARDKSRVFGNVRLRDEAFYGSFIEHGWRPGRRSVAVRRESRRGRITDKRLSELGDKRGKVQPRPWFNPTVERLERETSEAFLSKMHQSIMREWLR